MSGASPSSCQLGAEVPGNLQADRQESRARRAGEGITTGEWIFAAVALLFAIALRIRYASQISFNSDEPQHLHVVWGWATGRLQYRDVFDNHAPLFDILLSPVLRGLGERADILIWMRLAMLPLYLASLGAVFVIGKHVFSRRIGLWAAVLAAVGPEWIIDNRRIAAVPVFFFKMGEFRTDVLWTTLWLCSLAILLAGKLSARRCFVFGLVLGATMAVSMKTILMLFAVLVGAGTVLAVKAFAEKRFEAGRTFRMAGAAVLGFLIIPGALILFFAFQGALREMYYCIVQHQTMPHSSVFDRARGHIRYLIERFAVLFALAGAIIRWTPQRQDGLKRAFVVLTGGAYYLGVCGFWPIITPQDFQPSDPFLALCLAPILWRFGDFLASKCKAPLLAFIPAACAVDASFVVILREESLHQNGTSSEVAMISDVLRMTKPDEVIFDAKGECIYRPRAWYMVLETIARKKIKLGLLKDDLIEKTIAAKAPLAHGMERIQDATDRSWFEKNYLPVGHVLVLGRMLELDESGAGSFETVIPETYQIVADRGDVHGTLDGLPLDGPVVLTAGHHELLVHEFGKGRRFAVIWARAVEKGYSPFGQTPPAI